MAPEGEEEVTGMKLKESVGRGTSAVPCPCGGYADRVKTTEEERELHGCAADSDTWECCARAFLCRVCKKRLVGVADAPEMD